MIKEGKKVLKTIIDAGYEAYYVGGFVRDYLLGIDSDDIDITTNALPEQVICLFDKVIPTGIDHGTVTVIENGHSFEVTTYRTEGAYSNRRKPDTVHFGTEIEEDLSRRDFTINALIMDQNESIYDYHNGQADLMLHRIKTIGDPNIRFKEDALRMLRAIRFQAKLGFDIEENTMIAIFKHKDLLSHISIERVKNELANMFLGKYVSLALETLNKVQFPQLSFQVQASNSLTVLENFTALVLEHKLDKTVWKFSRFEQKFIKETEQFMDEAIDEYAVYRHEHLLSKIKVFEFLTGHDIYEFCMKLKETVPIESKLDLALSGSELQEEGFQGKEIGTLLDELEKAVVYSLIPNEKAELLEYVRRPKNDRNKIIASRSRSDHSCKSK